VNKTDWEGYDTERGHLLRVLFNIYRKHENHLMTTSSDGYAVQDTYTTGTLPAGKSTPFVILRFACALVTYHFSRHACSF
jgi:hypothetical protein